MREALKYIDASGKTAVARLVFNISFKAGAAPRSHLSKIDYTAPVPAAVHEMKGTEESRPAAVYDLSGRRAGEDTSRLQRGTYIIDGKVVVK